MAKIKSKVDWVKIDLKDSGIQELLKSDRIQDDLLEYGKKVAKEITELTETEEPWEANIHLRKTRSTVIISTDDEKYKWKEAATGKVAKHMSSKKYSGKMKVIKNFKPRGGIDD